MRAPSRGPPSRDSPAFFGPPSLAGRLQMPGVGAAHGTEGPEQPPEEEPMRTRSTTVLSLLIAAVAAVAAGCLDRPLAPVDPSTQSGVFVEINQTGTTKVDILFMVDNSNSMGLEQEVLAEQIVVMTEALINPPPGPDGVAPPSVQDLHIGIVTSDMGTGGYAVMTCANPMQGDNGVLQNVGRLDGCADSYSAPDCPRAGCPWLSHSVDAPDDGTDPSNPPIWEDFGCIATLGTGGCGLEQQLEATLVALTTQSAPGRPNEGFLRPDSLIAIIYVTDEDDCSAANTEIFNPSRHDLGPLNVRCALREDMLHPVSRYYDGFRALRPGAEDQVVVAAITGVPIDGSWAPGDPIDGLRAIRQVDPSDQTRLLPSCDTRMGLAFPPVRIAELVYMFGSDGILESICRPDWTQALTAISRKIQEKIPGTCVSRELASTDPGVCRVIERLVDDRGCPHLADAAGPERAVGWQLDLGLDETGRRQCEILPADYDGDGCPDGPCGCEEPYAGCLAGWFYQGPDASCPNGQVRFTSPEVTSDRSRIRIECRTALCPTRRQCVGAALAGDPCDPASPGSCGDGGVCVRHNSAAVCGGPGSCGRCSPRVGARCPAVGLANEYWADDPLVEAGGCCHEGFHCEDGNRCEPSRTLGCG